MKKSLLILSSLLMIAFCFQNCKPSDGPSAKGSSASGSKNQGIPLEGNGEGYLGKIEFVNYDLDNSCSQPTGGELIQRKRIEIVDGLPFLVRDNCQDISPVLLRNDEVDWRFYNPDHLFYGNKTFQDRGLLPETDLITLLMCRGEGWLDGVNDVDFLVQQNQTTGEMFMSYYLVFYVGDSREDKTRVDFVDEKLLEPAYYEVNPSKDGPIHLYGSYANEQLGWLEMEIFETPPSDLMGTGWYYATDDPRIDGVLWDCYPHH